VHSIHPFFLSLQEYWLHILLEPHGTFQAEGEGEGGEGRRSWSDSMERSKSVANRLLTSLSHTVVRKSASAGDLSADQTPLVRRPSSSLAASLVSGKCGCGCG